MYDFFLGVNLSKRSRDNFLAGAGLVISSPAGMNLVSKFDVQAADASEFDVRAIYLVTPWHVPDFQAQGTLYNDSFSSRAPEQDLEEVRTIARL